MKAVAQTLNPTARLWLPRLLTQVCRDPTSPLWGSFDRDWWHYRIRDFPSIILQQGGYSVYLASQWNENAGRCDAMRQLAAAACRFWNHRAIQRGAFEEYYPWEQGYPPLAFSTLAVMKLAAEGAVNLDQVRAGAVVAARQLQACFESQAANQQIAGLAALAWCRKNFQDLAPESGFESLVRKSLALQTPEGWFEEYGGPDLGYLSVTVDCLWDLFDATGDERFLASIDRALACIKLFIQVTPDGGIGMHNSRNTDYLVPYGMVRAALRWPTEGNMKLVRRLFGNANAPAHFFNAIDDRYVCHYIGQSLFRAVLILEQVPEIPSAAPDSTSPGQPVETAAGSGHFLRRTADGQCSLVTLRKGGIFSHHNGGNFVNDFGWVVHAAGRQFISHWWSDDWRHGHDGSRLWVEGVLYEHKDVASTPAKHMALRFVSLIAGSRVISLLKQKLIFNKKQGPIQFRRTIEWIGGEIHVIDSFKQLPARAEFLPAPRSSKRHVASADSFHAEDFQPVNGFDVTREFHPSARGMEIKTVYAGLRERA